MVMTVKIRSLLIWGMVICDHTHHVPTEAVADIAVISRHSSKDATANTSETLNSTSSTPVTFNSTTSTNETFNGTAMTPENFNTSGNASDAIELGEKIKNAMEDIMDGRNLNDNSTTTEFAGIDSTGCNRGMRKELEEQCDVEYDRVNEEAQQIEDERQKTEAVCCSLEDFEKCSLRAYDKASCVTDKAAVRENLKAARLFLSVIGNITCSEFRGQCAFYNSAPSVNYNIWFSIAAALTSIVVLQDYYDV